MGDTAQVPVKPAASIMLVRNSTKGLEVLMMRRSDKMAFAPGALVFPGGRVDQSDGERCIWHKYTNRYVGEDRAFRIAALRELWEETDLLFTDKPYKRLRRSAGPLTNILRQQAAHLDIKGLVPFAQWITPEGLPRRYDTHFFIGHYKGGDTPKADGEEAVSEDWLSPHALLADWEKGAVPLMFPTRLNLLKLARSRTAQAAIMDARRRPVVRVLPVISGEKRTVVIPEEAGFGVTAATPRELNVESPIKRA